MTHLYVRHDSFICETWLDSRVTAENHEFQDRNVQEENRLGLYNTLQHTATHCNRRKTRIPRSKCSRRKSTGSLEDLLPGRWLPPYTMVTATHRNTPQHTATHRNTPQFAALQHTAWPLAPSLHNDLCCSAVLQCVALVSVESVWRDRLR